MPESMSAPDTEELRIRPATPTDAAIIAHHRAAMFQDMGRVSPEEYQLLRAASESWIAGVLANQQYIGWLVEDGSGIVAGGGLLLREQFPTAGCYKIGQWAHIMNVYTKPEYRRRGLARRLMILMIDWCAAQKIDQVTLTASDEGRHLYESLGFVQTSDMRLPNF
jgi:GNAT superfamily N-acetyltransferase